MKKRDLFFALALLIIFGAMLLFIPKGEKGKSVVVTLGGKVFGEYYLTEEKQEIKIGNHNTLTIVNNEAFMSMAECPDQICVNKGKIKLSGEDIICMPNKVIVRIKGDNDEN